MNGARVSAEPPEQRSGARVTNHTDAPVLIWIDGEYMGELAGKSCGDVPLGERPPASDADTRTVVLVSSEADAAKVASNGISLSSLDGLTSIEWGRPAGNSPSLSKITRDAAPSERLQQHAQVRAAAQRTTRPGRPLPFDLATAPAAATRAAGTDSQPLLVRQNSCATFVNSLGMIFVEISAGSFTTDDLPGPPGRRVTVTKPFFMSITEVTRAQWNACRADDWRQLPSSDLPMTSVTWSEAHDWWARLASVEGLHYSLPTEAQWELACRGNSSGPFNVTGVAANRIAWYANTSGGTVHPVAQLLPNSWGLFDMHGNVREWCSDWWSYTPLNGADPTGAPRGTERSRRGGAFDTPLSWCASGFRDSGPTDSAWEGYGFRVVMVLDGQQQ